MALLRLRIPDSVNIPIILTLNKISIESIPLSKKMERSYHPLSFLVFRKFFDCLLYNAYMNYNRHSSFSELECCLVEIEKYLTLLFPILAFNLKLSATKTLLLGMSG